MSERSIAVSRFKAECLGLLGEVAETGEELIVTKRGKPLARVIPITEPPTLRGSVRLAVSDDELLASIDEPWDVESP